MVEVASGRSVPERAWCEMPVRMRPRVVHVHEGLTPLRAWELNLHAVTDALTVAGLHHFVVRGTDDRVPVVAVRQNDREAVLAALHALCRHVPGYVSTIQPAHDVGDPLLPGGQRSSWRKVEKSSVIRLTWLRTDPTRNLVLDSAYGCDVEFWGPHDTREGLFAPRPNRVSRLVREDTPPVRLPGERFTRLATGLRSSLRPVSGYPEFDHPLPDDIDFPIDVVYTWVDGMDPAWQARHAEASGAAYHPEAASQARYIDREELRYSLRSLYLNAPWVRKIFIVTDDQTPSWLDTTHPQIRMVSHKDIFSDPTALPTFNSFAIESQLHRIDGLSEQFLYLNDDMFIGRPLVPQMFFLGNGLSRFFHSRTRIPQGPVVATDTPIDATIKNDREIIAKCFGRTITQGFLHVPYPLRRTVLTEIEERFPTQHRTTMTSRFRSMDNLSITYSLHHYYAFHTGRAVPGTLKHGYVQLEVPDLADRLDRALARRDWDAFCLNDNCSDPADIEAQTEILKPFLEAYFPVRSPYEKP